MGDNIEIKARLGAGQAVAVRAAAEARSDAPPERLHQVDTFYRAVSARLKLRRLGDGTAELIAYERPDRAGPKRSTYVLVACPDPDALHAALARTVGVRGTVEKRREVIHVGQTRVHLDEVAGLGSFLELEVVLRDGQSPEEGEAIARELRESLGVEESALIEGAYIDLLEQPAEHVITPGARP